jgi:hypothetical protein
MGRFGIIILVGAGHFFPIRKCVHWLFMRFERNVRERSKVIVNIPEGIPVSLPLWRVIGAVDS